MPAMTKPETRKIIDDFAREILVKRLKTAKPSKDVINFRTDIRDGIERVVWRLPINLLRYRKDNGRIASDVLDYENNIGPLHENDIESQERIAKFLEDKDPEKTAVLRKTILHDGQREPAIITCDGFLINGNRRKMVMEGLHRDHPESDEFAYMKCIILPGKDDEGGPPTLLEIEKLENRYQLQADGKSEYYGFDRALSIRRKIELGLSLEDQLRDDPRYAKASKSDLDKAVKRYEKDFLQPLECVDRYLKQFGRASQYRTVSAGISDREGRWQAFLDYSNTYSRYFDNPKNRIDLGIEEDEIGTIEEAAFDIIRLRVIPDMPKVHQIMRELPKYCRTKEGKKEIRKIAEEVEPILPREEALDPDGNPLSIAEIDAKWAAKYKQPIIHRLKKASKRHESEKEKETPLDLLEAAHKKLTHDNMDITAIKNSDLKRARDLTVAIKTAADEIESGIYRAEKQFKKLVNK